MKTDLNSIYKLLGCEPAENIELESFNLTQNKVIVVARVSTLKQLNSGSFERQVEAINNALWQRYSVNEGDIEIRLHNGQRQHQSHDFEAVLQTVLGLPSNCILVLSDATRLGRIHPNDYDSQDKILSALKRKQSNENIKFAVMAYGNQNIKPAELPQQLYIITPERLVEQMTCYEPDEKKFHCNNQYGNKAKSKQLISDLIKFSAWVNKGKHRSWLMTKYNLSKKSFYDWLNRSKQHGFLACNVYPL